MPHRQTLTDNQAAVLGQVYLHINQYGCPPTLAELAKALGFKSPNAAGDHLIAIEKKGFIEIRREQARGIKILRMPSGEALNPVAVAANTDGVEIRGNGLTLYVDEIQARAIQFGIGRELEARKKATMARERLADGSMRCFILDFLASSENYFTAKEIAQGLTQRHGDCINPMTVCSELTKLAKERKISRLAGRANKYKQLSPIESTSVATNKYLSARLVP